MELRHLRYFLAAVEEGSLQRAALRMNVAQPALLRRIRDLEQELGCTLLHRHSRGVAPTAAGAIFYRKVMEHLTGLDDAAGQARRMGGQQKGDVRVGLVQNSRRYSFVNQAIANFRTDDAHAPVSFIRDLSPRLFEALRERRLDLTFLYEAHQADADCGYSLIHSESLVLALHPDHERAAPGPIDLAEIADIPLVWLSLRQGGEYHDALFQHLRSHGVEPVIALRADSYEELIDLTTASGGACITAASTILAVPDNALVFRPIRDMEMALHLGLAWNHTHELLPAGVLLRHLQAEIALYQQHIRSGKLGWSRIAGQDVVHVPG